MALNLSKIRILSYTLDIYNFILRSVICVIFRSVKIDKKKEKVVSFALFMNFNAKKPQKEHSPCPKYGVICKPHCRSKQNKKKQANKHLTNDPQLRTSEK